MTKTTTSKRAARKTGAKKTLSAAAIERANLVAFRSECAAMPRDAWVARIKNPRQRILADAVAKICALFGIPPDVLRHDRSDQSPLSRNENSLRGIALGACIDTGLAMGCSWNELHTHAAIGRSEVLDLPPHASAIRVARARWTAVQTMDGIVLEVARARVAIVAAEAIKSSKKRSGAKPRKAPASRPSLTDDAAPTPAPDAHVKPSRKAVAALGGRVAA